MLTRVIPVSVAVASFALAPFAFGETIWATGVSQESGWTDVNKNGNNDSQLCWAAAASNIINWWQNKADAAQIPAGTPIGGAAIFDTFRTTFYDVGRGADVAWKWYFGGCDLVSENYENDFRDASKAKTSGRYWQNYVVETLGWTNPVDGTPDYILSDSAGDVSADALYADELATTLCRLFEKGAGVTLAIAPGGNWAGGHAITLWGMEYEGNRIKTLYITDSDDSVTGVCPYSVAYKTTTETGGDGKEDSPFYEWTKTTIYLQNYYGRNDYEIKSWGALSLNYAIPEPSAFGFLAGLGALVLVVSRRNRKFSAD